ncbi:MAG: hypothetical protein KGM47_00270 [Acidobacteriota bacterium]|nr:hypothetical protein [Acidobacteriota bacterium]
MKKSLVGIAALAACLMLACLAASASDNAQAQPLTGTWTCISHGGENGDMNFTLYMEQNGQNVTGSVSSQLGDADFASASFKGNQLTITIDGDSDTYTLTGTLKAGKLAGTWSTNNSGHKGAWEGKKSASQ